MNTVVIVDQDAGDLPAYASSNERDVAIHVGVIRGNRGERQPDPWNAEPKRGREDDNAQPANQQPSLSYGLVAHRAGLARHRDLSAPVPRRQQLIHLLHPSKARRSVSHR